jgi:hypothetical protein
MLKAVVIGLGVLIVIALGLVVVGIVRKFSAPGAVAAAQSSAVFALPPGAVVVEMQSQSNRLVLRLHTPAGDEVDIVDTEDARIVARIK